jgi:hypothetical protein
MLSTVVEGSMVISFSSGGEGLPCERPSKPRACPLSHNLEFLP